MEASLAEIEQVILRWDLVCQDIFSPILTGKWIAAEYCHFQHTRQLEPFLLTGACTKWTATWYLYLASTCAEVC